MTRFAVSVPHGGLEVPSEVEDLNQLAPFDIAEDGDRGAAEIYAPLREIAQTFVSTAIARAFVDMNRAEDDRRKDGVVKTHTCVDVPIYRTKLTDGLVEHLLAKYHRPYHQKLSEASKGARFGIDCHTMFATGPVVGPDAGQERPRVLLANVDGSTFPDDWMALLAQCLGEVFECRVALNEPFRGGYIIRAHAPEMPWVMLELSRGPFLPDADKAERVRDALERFCARIER